MPVVDAADEYGSTDYIVQGDRRRHRPDRRSRSAPRSTWSSGSPPSTRSTRSSASTRWSARARRCTASTPAISPGCSRGSCAARCRNRITVPDDVAEPGTGGARADARGQAEHDDGGLTMSPRRRRRQRYRRADRRPRARARCHEVTRRHEGRARREQHRVRAGRHRRRRLPRRQVADARRDTLAAGAGLGDAEAVEVLCSEAPARIRDLLDLGVRFDTRRGRRARPRARGGALARRVLHAGGDATGAEIERALVARRAGIRDPGAGAHVPDRHRRSTTGRAAGVEVLLDDGTARHHRGRRRRARQRRRRTALPAHHQPGGDDRRRRRRGLACGSGAGGPRVLPVPPHRARDRRIVPRLRGGARRGRCPARMRRASGSCSTCTRMPSSRRATSSPAASPSRWRRRTARPCCSTRPGSGAEFLARRFPTIDAACRRAGFDWSRVPIPVTPAAHYWMGGVATDTRGRSTVPGLYAVGEVACTGVHGANRLASNSLLESIVFAHRAAQRPRGRRACGVGVARRTDARSCRPASGPERDRRVGDRPSSIARSLQH